MYLEGESIYCKSITGKCLEISFGTFLLIVLSPFLLLYAMGTYSKLLCMKAERLDDRICKKLAEFFG